MKKHRKHYTPEEKVAILRRHLLEKEPISKLCDELGLQPTVFYRWQKEFFENGASAFEQKARPNHSAEQERIAYLEKKIQTNDEVQTPARVPRSLFLVVALRHCLHNCAQLSSWASPMRSPSGPRM
jgi:transposase